MDLEGNIARFTEDEQAAMQYRYPAEVDLDHIDTEALMGGIEEREDEYQQQRAERERLDRVREARRLRELPEPEHDGVNVGETTQGAFQIIDDRQIVMGIVEQIHAYRMGVTLDGPAEGIPND